MNDKSTIILENKERLSITGVNKIHSFDQKHFNIDTFLGDVQIYGDNLEMDKLDSDSKTLFIVGNITQINYRTILQQKENLFKKIFK